MNSDRTLNDPVYPVVVDKDVDVRDPRRLLWKVLAAIDPERDIEIAHGPVDELDHASPMPCLGSKIGIDATAKGPDEGRREWPGEIEMSRALRRVHAELRTSHSTITPRLATA